jgi:adenine/guanine/hypoxanthine permease
VPAFATLVMTAEEHAKGLGDLQIIVALGNGFILTGMLWGALIACLISGTMRQAFVYSLVCATFTFFGVIHSAMPDGNMYFPWRIDMPARLVPYQFTAAYLVLAAVIFSLSFTRGSKEIHPAHA